jgi:hypothetical protein
VLPVFFRRQLRLIIIMDGTTHIATEAIITDIARAGTIICTGIGFFRLMVAVGIIAIGKQPYSGELGSCQISM